MKKVKEEELTIVRNADGVLYQIDDDNNIHACQCQTCGTRKPVDEFKNVSKGICLSCGKTAVSDDIQALDEAMHKMIEGYDKSNTTKRTVHLNGDTLDRIATLQERYGVAILSTLTNEVLTNALDQIEAQYEQELAKGLK